MRDERIKLAVGARKPSTHELQNRRIGSFQPAPRRGNTQSKIQALQAREQVFQALPPSSRRCPGAVAQTIFQLINALLQPPDSPMQYRGCAFHSLLVQAPRRHRQLVPCRLQQLVIVDLQLIE